MGRLVGCKRTAGREWVWVHPDVLEWGSWASAHVHGIGVAAESYIAVY